MFIVPRLGKLKSAAFRDSLEDGSTAVIGAFVTLEEAVRVANENVNACEVFDVRVGVDSANGLTYGRVYRAGSLDVWNRNVWTSPEFTREPHEEFAYKLLAHDPVAVDLFNDVCARGQ